MISFQVNDMHCGHCVRSITQAVNGLDAAARLQFDLGRHQVHIASAAADAAPLAEAIRTAGFSPAAIGPPAPNASPGGPGSAPVRKGCCCG